MAEAANVSRTEISPEGGELPELRTVHWRAQDAQFTQTSFRQMLRRLPALVAHAARLAWVASRRDLVIACGLQVTAGIFTAGGLLAARSVLDALFTAGPTPDRVRAAVPSVVVVVAATVARGGVQVAAGWAQARLTPAVTLAMETRLLRATTATDLAAFDDADFCSAMQRADDRGPLAATQVVDSTVDIIAAVLGLLAAAAALAVLDPVLLPLLAAATVPQGWAAVRSARRLYVSQYRRSSIRRRKWLLSWLMTSRDTATDLRAFTLREWLLGQYGRIARWELRADLRLTRQQTLTHATGQALSGVASAAVYTALGVLLATGHMPLATAGTAVLAIQVGRGDLGYLVMAVNHLYEGGLYLTDYLAFLADAEQRTPAGTSAAPQRFDRITVEDVSFTYPGAQHPAVDGVSLTITAGQIIALVGENGSGKTTLAKLVAGLYHPTSGRIRWDDVDLARVEGESLWARVAVVTQDYARWPFTARQNISLADERGIDAVRAAARNSGADEIIDALPHRYDTLLDRTFTSGVDLSGGQWQRVAVARGYHRQAPLLICDEPTAALDARAERAVFSKLRYFARDRTVILITHRLASVRHADHVYVLHRGRIEDHGTHDELLGRPGRYSELFTLQADAYTAGRQPADEDVYL